MKNATLTPDLLDHFNEFRPYVGNTPLLELKGFHSNPNVTIFAKAEWQQMGASVKARPAYNIMRRAIQRGELNRNVRLLDASSGNTGIAYAIFAKAAGIPITLCIPENASKERKDMLEILDAQLIFTSKFEGTDGAQRVARELKEKNPEDYFYADQYNNEDNWKAHFNTTASEILHQTYGEITHFVAGLGTTGTFTGTARRLLEEKPEVTSIALQPETALHGLEGWKHLETAHVPGIFDLHLAHNIMTVDTLSAYGVLKKAHEQGLALSPSSAANLLGAIQVAEEIEEGTIVTIFADDATKYSEVINSILK